MITKLLIGVLAATLLGLAAFTVYDRWPNEDDWGPSSPRYPVSVQTPLPGKPCSESLKRTLEISCLKNGGPACTELANCR